MEDYPAAQAYDSGGLSPKSIQMPSLKTRLEQAVKDAQSRLDDAKEARDILDKNPDLEKLLNIMQRGRF